MDRDLQRRSTVSVQSSAPSSLRHCVYPTPAERRERRSLRHSPKKARPVSLQPAAVTRVKGDIAMDSRTSTDMSCTEDLPSMTASPKSVYSQTPRSKTPETSATLVNPSSSLLQDLLKEQRASRGSRGTMSEECDDSAPRTPDRSRSDSHSQSQSQSRDDPGSERQRKIHNALSSGLKQPREMGMRETDQYISKINKQNFDLKLEIFHRSQQIVAMEKKLERMAEMEEELRRMRQMEDELQELREAEEDNLRLRDSNEQLRQEIDKRDQAVTEAVDLICQLEAKMEELEAGQDASRPSSARSPSDDYDFATPKNKPTFQIPERRSSKRSSVSGEYRRVSSGSRSLKRPPSFLTDRRESTAALRSLYAPADDHCATSVITKSDSLNSMNETSDIESPRLSALSECSELNPYTDGTGGGDGFDQIMIPVRKREPPPEKSGCSMSSSDALEDRQIADWIQPQPDPFTNEIPQAKAPSLDVFRESHKPNFDSDSFLNGSSQRTPLDSVFGSIRLPPTPDTMSTAYAGGGNGSNGSADKGRGDQIHSVKRRLARPRSAGELTTRQSSANSNLTDDMNTDASKVTLPRRSLEEKEEIPAIFPLDSITSRTGALLSQESIIKPSFGHYGGNEIFNPHGLERVFSKMDRNHYSPAMFEARRKGPAASPPLTPQDWVEAAKSGSPAVNDQAGAPPAGPLPAGSRLVGARAPSQSSFLGRRHSIDSAVRDIDLPIVPTLELSSLERDPQSDPDPDPEPSRRRISLRPFFNRSGSSRRLQESPTLDFLDKDDCAPAPVVRKTRQIANSKAIRASQNFEDPKTASYGNLWASAPTYADPAEGPSHRTLPQSSIESSFTSNGTVVKNPPPHAKDHKRRTSLGIFGWVKEASGLGSLGKKSESADPMASSQSTSGMSKSRASSRLGQDGSGPTTTIPETNSESATLADMNIVVEDFAYNPKRMSRADEEEPGRRPRYMERRSRRV
ncbi:hypothetical protein P170DRAFT_505702 [Aspergillus steynii IBT 23096]|uniref:Centrosomin N-terminal motif 1 domain-containing protein n=1 Tax=Aspergillus steynii IBT 23096 TaxID=1392250 RepID=A0A2I2GQD3_9EURO|nr:uncharacterized protein P170DRAFT_505702 [Aspergillus steynii IBT 23096]PLB55078.1 hypothetical protein P170DRAFT_505702 [Aspergillus steynii IBT 23096]